MELGIPYAFLGADGSRFVVGNSNAAKADPDWIGWLDPDNGITGLLDGAEPRGSALPIPLGDGVRIGHTFLGERSGAVQGSLDPNATLAVVEGTHVPKLRRFAQAARRADGLMIWTPSTDGIKRMLRVRHVAGRPDIRGRRPKTFMLTLLSPDANVLSHDEVLHTIGPMNGATGVSSPITNAGDAPTWPRFYIDGPINDPQVIVYDAVSVHAVEVARLNLDVNLASNERVIVIPERGTILRGTKGEPGFEQSTAGWATAANYFMNAPTSLSRQTATKRSGTAAGQVVSPATQLTGASYEVFGPFLKGRTYVVRAWVRANANGHPMRVGVYATAEDFVHGPTVNSSAAFQEVTATWQPQRTFNRAVIFVQSVNAVALTWQIDDLSMKESGKAYDYAGMAIAAATDISGVGKGDAGSAATRFFQLPAGATYLALGCASSGTESYLRTVFNHAWA